MLTMNYQGLQYKYSRPKKKKQSQLKDEKYQLTKKNFSASTWKDYKEWVKEQKAKEKLQESLSSRKKKLKCKDTKVKSKKASQKPKKAISRKEQYLQDLEHPLWQKKRNVILKRDQFKCRRCGSVHNLQVHHIKYSEGKRPWEYPNIDLITLCEDCHKKVHQDNNNELNPYKKRG